MIRYFLSLFLLAAGALFPDEKPLVIVSVAPYKFLVDQVAAGSVEVFLIVPAGTSAHTYEPTPKDMMRAVKASRWFTLGEAFEKKAIGAIAANNPDFKTVDLTQGVDLITSDPLGGAICKCHGGADLHIWLSPKELKVQAATIAKALTEMIPSKKDLFEENLQGVSNKLDQIDQEIRTILPQKSGRVILVSHPAFGYFCRDYGIKQLSIEVEGKDPTPKRMHDLLTLVQKENIKKIFAQPQYSDKGAQLIAKEIGASVVILDPYKEDLFNNLLHLAHEFAND